VTISEHGTSVLFKSHPKIEQKVWRWKSRLWVVAGAKLWRS